MPSGGRPSGDVRALHTAYHAELALGGPQGDGDQARRRSLGRAADAPLELDPRRRDLGEGRPPHREDRVGGDERIAQRPRLVAVEPLGVVAVGGLSEVEVARHAQELVAADRLAAAVGPQRDVGLDRGEVAAGVEDDRQLVAEGEALDPHRDRRRPRLVEQRAPQKLLGGVVVVGTLALDHR